MKYPTVLWFNFVLYTVPSVQILNAIAKGDKLYTI